MKISKQFEEEFRKSILENLLVPLEDTHGEVYISAGGDEGSLNLDSDERGKFQVTMGGKLIEGHIMVVVDSVEKDPEGEG